jgi:hypothetical protein
MYKSIIVTQRGKIILKMMTLMITHEMDMQTTYSAQELSRIISMDRNGPNV